MSDLGDNDRLAERLSRLTPAQRALLLRSVASRDVAAKSAGDEGIRPRTNPDEPLPLSPAQLRMWFLEQLQPGTGSYHVYDYSRLRGVLDFDALQNAFREMVRRHEALRTSFHAEEGTPRQRVAKESAFAIETIDLRARAAADRESEAKRIVDEETLRPFDLGRAPLLRVVLVRIADDDQLLLLTLHHIIADAWSLDVIARELNVLYAAFRNRRTVNTTELPELGIQFGDVVEWLRRPAQETRLTEQIAWWKKTLAGVPDVLELPTDRPRPTVQTFRGGRQELALPLSLIHALRELARREHVTLFMTLLAAFETLLHRYAGQDEFVIGTPVANRNPQETEPLIGLFVNTVAIRANLGGDPTFRELLQRARETSLDAFAHEDVPFDRVIDSLGLERSAARTPLFQTMLVLWSGGPGDRALEGLRQEPISSSITAARFDLTLSMGTTDEGLVGVLDYAADLFDASTMARFAVHFETLLRSVLADPDRRVSELPLLTEQERQELLRPAPVVTRPDGATLHGLVNEQCRRTPEAVALRAPGRTITYGRLDRWTNGVARQLRERGVGAEVCVALLADRSVEAIAGVLAILKAGGAYLPIDPGTPAERLAWLLADAGVRTLLVPAPLVSTLPALASDVEMISIAEEDGPDSPPPNDGSENNTAYIIYTSGSTGLPKGVVVEHRSAVNLALAFAECHGFAGHRLLMIPPLPFDASVGDVFPILAVGATLMIHPSPAELNALELARFCNEHRISAIDAPAALWRRWTEEWIARGSDDPIPSLRLMLIGGESVPVEQVRRFATLTHGRVRLFNHYGPTEATVCATTFATIDAADVETAELPIGTPLANVVAYVLDKHLQPVPVGVPGELYIGGNGVARGYLGQPEATAARFVTDPFSAIAGARMYATGDLVRRRADGTLLFLGRSDRQIKLRGFRIEPGEIEAALVAHPGIRGAAVTLREDQPGQRRLAAYVVADEPQDPAALSTFLRQRLPDYMIPTAFVTLAELPLTNNGKVDFRALPVPPQGSDEERVLIAPRNETEQALAEIWRDVLGIARVGIDDDFFALGGDSLKSMPLIFRVHERFGVELPLSAVFTAPTVARFAPLVINALQGTSSNDSHSLESRVGAPPAITAAALAAARPAGEAPRQILLTGATGFLGAFLLDELLRATDATIHCLVRATTAQDGRRRIEQNLATYELSPVHLERIAPILGDLSLPQLGLDDATFDRLAHDVDLVYHNGGAVNFIAPYETLEPANVDGTRDVLQLAARHRVKPLHYVSTLGVHVTDATIGRIVHEADPLPGVDGIIGGYNQSKWIADQLVRSARMAGLPVSIYRPARIAGESHGGAFNPGDFFYTWIQGCVQLGSFPDDTQTINITPVDHVAAGIVRLSLRADAKASDHHFFNNRVLSLQRLVDRLNARGLAVEITPYRRWREELLATIARGEENALAKFAPLFTPEPDPGDPIFDCTRTEQALADLGLVCPSAESLIDIYLEQLINRGILAPSFAEVPA